MLVAASCFRAVFLQLEMGHRSSQGGGNYVQYSPKYQSMLAQNLQASAKQQKNNNYKKKKNLLGLLNFIWGLVSVTFNGARCVLTRVVVKTRGSSLFFYSLFRVYPTYHPKTARIDSNTPATLVRMNG